MLRSFQNSDRSARRLARSPVAAAVMGDGAIAVRREKEHLVFKRVSAERPSVTEDNRLSAAPVLIVDLGAVLGCKGRHDIPPLGVSVGAENAVGLSITANNL